MSQRHADVLALYGSWLGTSLVFGSMVPILALGPGLGWAASGGMFLLAGVVFGLQGAILLSSSRQYVGRYVIPPPLQRARLTNRAAVFLFASVALILGVLFVYLGVTILWLSSQFPG